MIRLLKTQPKEKKFEQMNFKSKLDTKDRKTSYGRLLFGERRPQNRNYKATALKTPSGQGPVPVQMCLGQESGTEAGRRCPLTP